ncbi:MAG: hypothetical protein E4H14_06885 [Candidatus Thorarchaeota archaeon]|nr:MAG: hypothetical protein E4H14_06885 [Candidatus Thorarchaeota archaeon]
MKRVSTLLFILFLVVAPMASVVSLSYTDMTTSFNFWVAEPDLVDDDDRRSHNEGDVELNMMYFAQAAPNDDNIYYVCRRGADTIAYFGVSRVFYCVGDSLLELEFPGSKQVIPLGEEPTGSTTNYFLGSDPTLWKAGLQDFALLRYSEIYPGIDLVYSASTGELKYEFIVAPHADPDAIRLSYPDADIIEVFDDQITISKDGALLIDTGLWAFQEDISVVDVSCDFLPLDINTMKFHVGYYDKSQELVVDPILVYSTFLGSSGYEEANDIDVENGYAYVTGYTDSANFPKYNGYDLIHNGGYDCFVTKLTTTGKSIVYSTFLGGSGDDYGNSIAVEGGCAYIAGYTQSSNYPTANAYDSTYNSNTDCFVTKLAADGQSLVYSTYLGGTDVDYGFGIAVESGYAYITGYTWSTNFPTINAYDSVQNGGFDCFVTKLATTGLSLVYSTYIGGSLNDPGYSIAVENGSAYITGSTLSSNFPTINAYDSTYNGGQDCFVTKLATNGQSLIYSTYLGGSDADWARGIAVESGYAYIAGYTWSEDFPTENAYDSTFNDGFSDDDDGFITKLGVNGQSLVYSTYLGGETVDQARDIVVDRGCTYVTGYAWSTDFPIANEYNSTNNGGYDCFVSMFTPDGQSLSYSRFIGSLYEDCGRAIAFENDSVYITGYTDSPNFPTIGAFDSTHSGAGNRDCFVLKIVAGDSDCDGISDWTEVAFGMDPFRIDSDNDNFLDEYELVYGSDPLDSMSYPVMPQAWYDAIYEDLDDNTTLIQYLISWSSGNATLLQTIIQQLDSNATLIQQALSWLDGNHTAIENLFTCLAGNATLLLDVINQLNGNTTRIELIAALVSQNTALIQSLNASAIGNFDEIRDILNQLGVTVGDSDCDGLDDLDELALGTDILCIDTDCDNLNDAFEVKLGTDPLDDDSDGDSYLDGLEVIAGTNPLDALDYPGSTQRVDVTLIILVVSGIGVVTVVAILFIKHLKGKS